jgi:hypothetical protein
MLLSPDEYYYLTAATGQPVPSPYSRRWLLPRLLGPVPARWSICTLASLASLPFVAAGFFHARGLAGWPLLFVTALLCALPGLRLPWKLRILADAPSFAGALAVAWSATEGPWWVTIPLALVLGATRESAPVFSALWAWSPWPLVGLVASGWWCRSVPPPNPDEEPWLVHPVREAWTLRRRIGLDGSLYLRPWGAALAGLCAPSWQLVATVAVAHAQLFTAQDTMRLAVWCAPVLCMASVQVLPPIVWPLAVLVTLVHREGRA